MTKIPLFLLLFLVYSITFGQITSPTNHQPHLSLQKQKDIYSHMELLKQFKTMYINKHFEKSLFDMQKGYLQTSISNNATKMPLNFFVEYNNMWWFSIIDKVIVPSIGYDYENNTGFIILNIHYDDNHILRATQYVKFNDDMKISYIETYGSPTFFTENNPLVQLDSYGNQIWLTTGYDLTYSIKAALLFFDSPIGKSFATEPKTKKAVETIKYRLKQFIKTH